MKKILLQFIILPLYSLILFLSLSFAGEEALDLESESVAQSKAKVTPSASSRPNFSLMGRVDLTSETTQPAETDGDSTQELSNNHFLIFLKVKASEKTSFMGEFIGQNFYYVDYKVSNSSKVQFGKLLVSFGDTRRFHHYYGGVQRYPDRDVMFPRIWSSEGVNFQTNLYDSELEFYWVNMSFDAASAAAQPTLTSTAERQAGGLRWTKTGLWGLSFILSGQLGEYYPGKTVYISGLDVYSEYNKSSGGIAKYTRFAFGIADATFAEAPGGQFYKRGDFIEVNTDYFGPGEAHFRYGTYIDDSRNESNRDRNSLSAGYRFGVDVIKILIEHEWNFEAVNEIDNDLFRVMASLDF